MAIPGVIFVGRPTPYVPAPPDPGRVHYLLWLESWDGKNWSLSDESSGLVVQRGIRGLAGVTLEHHRDQHANLAGSRWRDFRATDREVFLPLYVFHDGDSADWVAHNRAFARMFRGGKTAWLHIVQPGGEHRRIQVRYDKGLDEIMEMDPAFYGWAKYGVYLTAEQPYWEAAEPVREVFTAVVPHYFFGGEPVATGEETAGPPFHIVDDRSLDTSSIANDGDIHARPIIRIYGPSTSASVGVAGQVVEVPFEVPDGSVLTIDCHPTAQTAILSNGTTEEDVTGDLGTFDFPSIAPDAVVQLVTELGGVGGGRVEVDIRPLYEWGLS